MKTNAALKSFFVRFLLFAVILSLSLFCSCAELGFGAEMPRIDSYPAFENETHILIDSSYLINKQDGSVLLFTHHNPETHEIASQLYNNSVLAEAFSFEVNSLYDFNTTQGSTPTQIAIIDYIKSLYKDKTDTNYTTKGTVRTINGAVWFSATTTDAHGFDSGDGLYEGIISSEIISYDSKTETFDKIFNYYKKDAIILDFDENGIFTVDGNGELNYYNFNTKETTQIWQCDSSSSLAFDIADDYICAGYTKDSKGYYFVYKKHGEIIADTVYFEF